MKSQRAIRWLALLLVTAGVVTGWLVWHASLVSGTPSLSYSPVVNLGEQERGTQVTGRLTFANVGGGELIIKGIRTSCACSGLERETPEGPVGVDQLTLGAKESVDLVVRLAVNAPAGAAYRTGIEFQSNDPKKPAARVELLVPFVKGGIVTIPTSVQFGQAAMGAPVKQVLEVRDLAERPRSIGSVSCSDPRVRVRLLPLERSKIEGKKEDKDLLQGTLIAHLEVEIDTSSPGKINAELSLSLPEASHAAALVPLAGKIAALVEGSPSTLTLPRISSGNRVYSTTAAFRSSEGQPFELRLSSCPQGLIVSGVMPGHVASEHTITVTWDPELGKDLTETRPARILFSCQQGNNIANVELPVYCWKGK